MEMLLAEGGYSWEVAPLSWKVLPPGLDNSVNLAKLDCLSQDSLSCVCIFFMLDLKNTKGL